MCCCTHRESVEQVCEHLCGQRALPLAQEGAQSLSEDSGDPIHIHVSHEPQLHAHTVTDQTTHQEAYSLITQSM